MTFIHYIRPIALDPSDPNGSYSLAEYPLGGMGSDICLSPLVGDDTDDSFVSCTLDEGHEGFHAWHVDGDVSIVWETDREHWERTHPVRHVVQLLVGVQGPAFGDRPSTTIIATADDITTVSNFADYDRTRALDAAFAQFLSTEMNIACL